MAEEVEQDNDSATNRADSNSVLDRGNDQADEHESEPSPPNAASVISRRVPSISALSNNFSPRPPSA